MEGIKIPKRECYGTVSISASELSKPIEERERNFVEYIAKEHAKNNVRYQFMAGVMNKAKALYKDDLDAAVNYVIGSQVEFEKLLDAEFNTPPPEDPQTPSSPKFGEAKAR